MTEFWIIIATWAIIWYVTRQHDKAINALGARIVELERRLSEQQ